VLLLIEKETISKRNTPVGFEVLTAVTMEIISSGTCSSPMFQENILLPLSGLKSKPQEACSKQSCLLLDNYLLGLYFDPQERNVCSSETSVNYQTTQNYIPEDSTLQGHSSL
jgi:hypothetical protein